MSAAQGPRGDGRNARPARPTGERLDVVGPLHRRTARDYLGRMTDGKVECMKVARRYDRDFWDGERRFGYGGYRYDGRWEAVARALVARYGLGPGARILDVGCGKGFLLHEFRRLLPDATLAGFDLSEYALGEAPEDVRPFLFRHDARDPFPYADGSFDLVVSITTLHNLRVFDLAAALREMERVGRRKYLVVESFRDEAELFNLQCWALTCAAFFEPAEWVWLFGEAGYSGDYEFIYFE